MGVLRDKPGKKRFHGSGTMGIVRGRGGYLVLKTNEGPKSKMASFDKLMQRVVLSAVIPHFFWTNAAWSTGLEE